MVIYGAPLPEKHSMDGVWDESRIIQVWKVKQTMGV